MKKKYIQILSTLILILFLAACPDPGSSETPGTPGSGDDDNLTTEQVSAACEFLLNLFNSEEILAQSVVEDSGVAFSGDIETCIYQVIFDGHSLRGYDFNRAGYETLTGTMTNNQGTHTVDITLTGGSISHVECTLFVSSNPKVSNPEEITITIDGTEYTIPFPSLGDDPLPEGIPENCYITNDTYTISKINTPPWPDKDQRCDVASQYIDSTASKDSTSATSETPNAAEFTYNGKSYPFYGKGWATVEAADPGNALLQATAKLDVEGINFPSAPGDMQYKAFGTANHKIYFSARSDSPDTTRIEVSFSISAQAHLTYGIDDEDDHATSFTSFTADADIYRMGWYQTENDDYEWADTDFVAGSKGGSAGYAVVGYTDNYNGSGTGLFSGDVSPTTEDTVVMGSEVISCEIIPETEMLMMSLNIMARSIIEFTGIGISDVGIAEATCYNAQMSSSYSACDPDDRDAEITLTFYIPDF